MMNLSGEFTRLMETTEQGKNMFDEKNIHMPVEDILVKLEKDKRRSETMPPWPERPLPEGKSPLPPMQEPWRDPIFVGEAERNATANHIKEVGVRTDGGRNPLWEVKGKPEMLSLREVSSVLDDNGEVYLEKKGDDVGRLPDHTYVLNGNTYKTDDEGRIIYVEAKPELTPDNPRDNAAQGKVGGKDRKEGDQGGHIVGRDMSGDGGYGNLVPMDGRINQSDYKKMEHAVKDALIDGKDVTMVIEPTYQEGSQRPDQITVTVQADGNETVYTFDNNMEEGTLAEALLKDCPEEGSAVIQTVLDETGGSVSSMKETHDADGNLERTVTVTYKDEETGSTYRREIIINTGGTQG